MDEDVYSFIPLLLVSFAEFLPHSLTFIRRYIWRHSGRRPNGMYCYLGVGHWGWCSTQTNSIYKQWSSFCVWKCYIITSLNSPQSYTSMGEQLFKMRSLPDRQMFQPCSCWVRTGNWSTTTGRYEIFNENCSFGEYIGELTYLFNPTVRYYSLWLMSFGRKITKSWSQSAFPNN